MDFVRPEYKEIVNKLKQNDKLIKHLTDIGSLITMDDYYKIFSFSSKRNPTLYIKQYNNNVYEKLASFIYDNREAIEKESLVKLSSDKKLTDELKVVIGFDQNDELDDKIFYEIFYFYKNTYADNFFQNNWKSFIPEYDVEMLENNEAAMSFVEAMMVEFDKIDEMINNVEFFNNFEEIPEQYINYLSQLLGLEQKDFYITSKQIEEYRILAANILEIYKKKGELSTFELMLKFLGYRVSIKQYYFDRRYYFSAEHQNMETISSNKNSYKFYLTENDPRDNILDNFPINEIVTQKDIVYPLNLDEFDNLAEKYGVECVLGIDDYYTAKEDEILDGKRVEAGKSYKYDNKIYSFFKTNLVKIAPKPFGKYANYTTEQIRMLEKILDFLSPYFWKRQLVIIPDLNNIERLTVNGHRGTHLNEDNDVVNDEGFRLLDSETWIALDENSEAKEQELARLEQVKNDLVLKTSSEDEFSDTYVSLHDNTVLLTEAQYSRIKNKKKYTPLYTYSKSNKVYAKDVKNIQNLINYKDRYYNSIYVPDAAAISGEEKNGGTNGSSYVGEEKGYREYSYDGKKTNYEVVLEPIGKKIININSTKGWGKIKEANISSSSPVYPFWTMDYIPTKEGNDSKSAYFYPTLIGENHLYLPKHNAYDSTKQWNNIGIVDLYGLEGDTLKNRFLSSGEEKEIRWVLPENKTLVEFLLEPEELTDYKKYTTADGKISFSKVDLFETAPRKIQNFTWKQVLYNKAALIIKKDKTEIINKEKELWEIANRYKLATKSIYKLDKEEINKIDNFDDWKKFRELIKQCKNIQGYEVLSEFVKKHNVVNYDYINEDLIDVKIQDLKFIENNDGTYRLNDIILSNVTNVEDSYLLVYNEEIDGFIVFKLYVEKGGRYNRYFFKKINNSKVLDKIIASEEIKDSLEEEFGNPKRISHYYIDDPRHLVYAESEKEFCEEKRLLFKDGKTYVKATKIKDGKEVLGDFEVTPTTFIEIDSLNQNEPGKKYIASMQTTLYRKPYSLKNDYELTASEQGREVQLVNCKEPNKMAGNFYYSDEERAIYQNVYRNIKEGDYIYSPKENKIYQFTSDYVTFAEPANKKLFSSYDYFEYTKEQEQVMYSSFKKDDPDTEEDERIIKYRFINDNGVEEETDGWPVSFTLKDKAYELLKEDNKPELSIFGIKEVELFGNIVYEDKVVTKKDDNGNDINFLSKMYKIKTYESNYHGISEADDNDNYILNNYDRVADWEILRGCDTRYLEDGIIKRPTRLETDKVFEEALKSKEHVKEKDNDKQIVANLLSELVGNIRFFGQNNIARLEGVNND